MFLRHNLGMTRTAVYSGTFDPITLGHEDVIRRAAALFDHVIVAVSMAHSKKTLFDLSARVDIAQIAIKSIANVSVMSFDGLLVDFCCAQGAGVIVRGVRNAADLDYEVQMAAMNRMMAAQIETVFLTPEAQLQCISSTLVREISRLGGDVSQMVSPGVVHALVAAHRPEQSA